MILLDTSILLYAVGDEHPLRRPCRLMVDSIGNDSLAATTTIEVIQEFVNVRSRRRPRADAVPRARSYARLLSPLLQPTQVDLETGMSLDDEHERLDAFDALLAAVALNTSHITGVVSAERAIASVPALRHVDPAAWADGRG